MRRAFGLVTVLIAVACPAAAAAPLAVLPAGDHVLPVATVNGAPPRSYVLHVPPGYDGTRALPVVLVFHGTFGNARNVAAQTAFNAVADREGFFVAYPQAAGVQWNDGREASRTAPAVDDVAFVAALIDQLGKRFVNLDARRVYATGMSSGGILAYRLGVELADRIAAIAPVAAVLPYAITGRPSRAVPVAAFNGTNDDVIAYGGRTGPAPGEQPVTTATVGGPHPSVPATLTTWAGFDGCTSEASSVLLPDTDPLDGTRVTKLVTGGCRDGAEVVQFRIDGGGHAWPSPNSSGLSGAGFGGGHDYTASRDIDAATLMWDFFTRHPLR